MTGLARAWGIATAGVLAVLGLIHCYWAAGGGRPDCRDERAAGPGRPR
jgi:hypothetical protein